MVPQETNCVQDSPGTLSSVICSLNLRSANFFAERSEAKRRRDWRPRIVCARHDLGGFAMYDPIKASICGEIALLLFDRPKAFNAFDLDAITVFAEHLINLSGDDTVRGIVISGAGTAFCAGGDLKWVAGWPSGYASAFHNLAARYHQAILEIRRMRKPVIAAINGIAAGGGFLVGARV